MEELGRGIVTSILSLLVFGEKQHALGSWLKYLAIQDVIAQDLKGKK